MAIEMDVHPRIDKCVAEELREGEHASIVYSAPQSDLTIKDSPTYITVVLTEAGGNSLYEKADAPSGSAAFISSKAGEYQLCFRNKGPHQVRVSFEFKVGAESEDFTDLATKEHLEPIEIEMKRIEAAVKDIHAEMLSQKAIESKMREINEATNSRVMWYSVFSIIILLALGAFQILYLKNFFKKRKFF